MKFNSALKKSFEVVTNGFCGAILAIFAGLCLTILVGGGGPALPYFGIGHVIEKWKQTWTEDEFYAFLISTGMVGFLLGAVIGSRYPQLTQKWNGPAVFISVPLIFIGSLIYAYSGHVEFPKKKKLADCSKVTVIHLEAPKGSFYRVVIVPPEGSTNSISGHISISDGKSSITNFLISINQLEQPCNFFKPQSNYTLEIEFDQLPPSVTSVWLNWLQAYKDK